MENCDFKSATFHALNRTQYEQIVNSKASYKNGNAIIEFDRTKTNETEIKKAINSTNYKVADKKQIN